MLGSAIFEEESLYLTLLPKFTRLGQRVDEYKELGIFKEYIYQELFEETIRCIYWRHGNFTEGGAFVSSNKIFGVNVLEIHLKKQVEFDDYLTRLDLIIPGANVYMLVSNGCYKFLMRGKHFYILDEDIRDDDTGLIIHAKGKKMYMPYGKLYRTEWMNKERASKLLSTIGCWSIDDVYSSFLKTISAGEWVDPDFTITTKWKGGFV